MNTVLMWIGGLLIAILTALFAGPYFVDWNGYRGVMEEEASRVLGRDVRVGGAVNLRLLPSPYVRFEDIRIADTSGITGAPLFKAGSFTMWLSVPPLLKGVLEAREIELDKPELRLATDRSGRGNWQNLRLQRGSLPFVPAGVTLQSVRIVDGTIGFDQELGGPLFKIAEIDGELSARDIAGPFSFHGTGLVGGAKRDIRLATTEAGSDGTFRLKASARAPGDTDLYTLDARIEDLDTIPKVIGTLSARLRLRQGLGAPEAEIRGELKASSKAIEVDNVVVSFEDVGQPQLVTGSFSGLWGARHEFKIDLSSRWLDLDRLMGVAPPAATSDQPVTGEAPPRKPANPSNKKPLAMARSLFAGLIDALPKTADLDANISVDQINLGGDTVSDIRLVMARAGGPMELRKLRANLPGGARLDFSGRLEPGKTGPAFAGQVFIGGPSVARLLKWASVSDATTKRLSDGPFAASGLLSLGAHSIDLADAELEFSGVPLKGAFVWRDAPERRLELRLEGHEIDTRWIGLSDLDLDGVLADVTGSKATASSDGAAAPQQDGEPASTATILSNWSGDPKERLTLRIRAGRLKDAKNTLHDVDAEISFVGKTLDIGKLRFVTGDGLTIEADGDIAFVKDKPRGSLKWITGAKTPAAASSLADLLLDKGVDSQTAVTRRLRGLAPFRLAGRLDLGSRSPASADITLDGTVRGRRAQARLQFDQGLKNWHKAPADFLVTMDADDTSKLISLVAGEDGTRRNYTTRQPGRGTFKAAGIPDDGMLAFADVSSTGLDLRYDGQIAAGGTTSSGLQMKSGNVTINAANANDALGLLGLRLAEGANGTAASGTIGFERAGNDLVLSLYDLTIAQSRVAGKMTLASSAAGDSARSGRILKADLRIDRASLPAVLTGISRKSATTASGAFGENEVLARAPGTRSDVTASDAPGQPPSILSDAAFDLDVLSDVNADLTMRIDALTITEGMVINDATLSAKHDNGTLQVGLTSPKILDGQLASSMTLTKAIAGVEASGSLSFNAAKLAALFPTDKTPRATGAATLSVNFAGRALSPRALMSVMAGKGSLKLDTAQIKGLSPDSVDAVVETVLSGEADDDDEGFRDAVRQGLGTGTLNIGSKTLPATIADGALTFETLDVNSKTGRTSATIRVDLTTLQTSSAWQIVANAKQETKAPWPAVSVNYTGPLAEIGAIEPQIAADALQRELTVRRMERNVEELERLRRLDEEAAERARKREAERRAREAAEAAAAAAERAAIDGAQPVDIQPPPLNGSQPSALPPGDNPGTDTGIANQDPQNSDPTLPPDGTANADAVQIEELPPDVAPAPQPVRRAKRKPRRGPTAQEILQRQLFGGGD